MVHPLTKVIERALNLGASYLDIRLEKYESESISAENEKPKEATYSIDQGVGVRALAGGSWGFSASRFEGTEEKVIEINVEKAVKLAKAVKSSSRKVELAEVKPVEDKVEIKPKISPKTLSLEEKMRICVETSGIMLNQDPNIKKSVSSIGCLSIDKTFISSEGTEIFQRQTITLAGLYAQAVKGSISEFYSRTIGGVGGYELITPQKLTEQSLEIGRKAANLINAKPAPNRKFPVILDPEFNALLSHEITGHPSEADRVIGREAAWAGRAWWKDKVGEKVFSENVTIISDATLEGNLGSFKYDDEGVPAKRIVHIDRGILKDFLHNRETAKIYNTEPNGAARASAYLFAPLIRMTNTYIEMGDWTFEEMLEGIKEGVYMKGEKIPSIDSRRYNFQISAKEAYMIRNGELTELLRSPTLMGVAPEFMSSIDAVGKDLIIFPIPNCGKGDPMQTMMVGNGGPHIRGYGVISGPR